MSGKQGKCRVVRAGNHFGTQFCAHINAPFELVYALPANGRIGTDRVFSFKYGRHAGATQAHFFQFIAQFSIVCCGAVRYRNFHPIVTRLPQLFEDGIVVFIDGSGPEQHVHTNFHRCRFVVNLVISRQIDLMEKNNFLVLVRKEKNFPCAYFTGSLYSCCCFSLLVSSLWLVAPPEAATGDGASGLSFHEKGPEAACPPSRQPVGWLTFLACSSLGYLRCVWR